jgi:hypothetical protein
MHINSLLIPHHSFVYALYVRVAFFRVCKCRVFLGNIHIFAIFSPTMKNILPQTRRIYMFSILKKYGSNFVIYVYYILSSLYQWPRGLTHRSIGRAMAQAVSHRPLTAEARFRSRVCVHVGFVVDKVALGQVFPPSCRFSPVSFIPLVLR